MGINMVVTWSIFASPFFWTGYLVGGFNASEKYESQLGLLFPIYGKIKNVPKPPTRLHNGYGSKPWYLVNLKITSK